MTRSAARTARRDALEAHYYRIDGVIPGCCDRCASTFDDLGYQGKADDLTVCASCAREAVRSLGTDRPTVEMRPLSLEDAGAEAWQRVRDRKAAEDAERAAVAGENLFA